MSTFTVPPELQEDTAKVVQYLCYHMEKHTIGEMQLEGKDPEPLLDATFGYILHIEVNKCKEHGFEIVDFGMIGLVDKDADVDGPTESDNCNGNGD